MGGELKGDKAEPLDMAARRGEHGGYELHGGERSAASAMAIKGEGEGEGGSEVSKGAGASPWRAKEARERLGGKQEVARAARAADRQLPACSGGRWVMTGRGPVGWAAQCQARWAVPGKFLFFFINFAFYHFVSLGV